MGWNKITIDTLTSAEDMISYELNRLHRRDRNPSHKESGKQHDRRRDESHVCGSIAR